MKTPYGVLKDQFIDYVAGLRFPWLLGITLAVFVVNVFVPDCIPFADEIVLGLTAAVLAALKKPRPTHLEGTATTSLEQRLPPAIPPPPD